MPNLTMKVYDAVFAVTTIVRWANAREYQLAEKFLIDAGANCVRLGESGRAGTAFYLKDQRQFDAFYDFVSERRAADALSSPPCLEMDIHTPGGVVVTIAWADEKEYQLARQFLTDMGAACGQWEARRCRPEFFHLATEQQEEALERFAQAVAAERAE